MPVTQNEHKSKNPQRGAWAGGSCSLIVCVTRLKNDNDKDPGPEQSESKDYSYINYVI